jgi:hypothetical protein
MDLLETRSFLIKTAIILAGFALAISVTKRSHALGIGLSTPELTEFRDLAHERNLELHEERERELHEYLAWEQEQCKQNKQIQWEQVESQFRKDAQVISENYDSHSYEPGWNGRQGD